ncbi:MAG: cytidylate kinase-like family protein [Oscillospiraceae bacterium]|nr:cytidylate kinase-like family protein [Oscillospiraceae bacterium]
MEKYVVTLSRQFASMGRTIAQRMSEELGIEFYDRDIVEETSKRTGLDIHSISDVEENGSNIFAKRRFPLGMGLISIQNETFQVQSEIIKDFASKDKPSCIIVGRCADFVLRDHPRVLNIYIYAPYEARLKNCVEKLGMDEKTGKAMIQQVDRARETYRLRYSDGVRTVLDHRDLLIDSSRFGPEKTADLLCGVVRSVFGD